MTTYNIYKLVEKAVYELFSEDIKDFLLTMCIFNCFSLEQAMFMMELFKKVCGEFVMLLQSNSFDIETTRKLMGEFELLLSFTSYNDIIKMSVHHKKACEILKEPATIINTKGVWTFGSPSVVYMFYREIGKQEKGVQEIIASMPYYYQLANGHGRGAEYVMAAEWYFNQGDFENAEIEVDKALNQARDYNQSAIVICALFLQTRLTVMKGDYAYTLNLFEKMHDGIEQKRMYALMHTFDMCTGFVNAYLMQNSKIPVWLSEGNFNSSRLFFPAKAFSNIIYGRVLLIRGEYLKLLGIAGQFIRDCRGFPQPIG